MTKAEFIQLIAGYLNQPEIETVVSDLYIDNDETGNYISVSIKIDTRRTIEISMYDSSRLIDGKTIMESFDTLIKSLAEKRKQND